MTTLPELRALIETVQKAFAEIAHARTDPGWFTRGETGAYAQSRLWEQRGVEATAKLAAYLSFGKTITRRGRPLIELSARLALPTPAREHRDR